MTERTEVEKARPPRIDLDNWVVNGTGANHGRYLMVKWDPTRHATWVRTQADATRFKSHEAGRDAAGTGVPIRLVAPRGVVARVRALKNVVSERASGAEELKSLYWIHGAGELKGCPYTEGDGFCEACVTKTVASLTKRFPKAAKEAGVCVDGGWGGEEDSPPACTICHAPLAAGFTDYGLEEELKRFSENPPTTDPEDWAAVSLVCENLPNDSPLWLLVDEWVKKTPRSTKRTPSRPSSVDMQ